MKNITTAEPVEISYAYGMPVKLAYLQTGITIHGHMTTETNLSSKKYPGMKMEYGALGLKITFASDVVFVPSANIKNVLLA